MNAITKRVTVSGFTLFASTLALIIPIHASEVNALGAGEVLLLAADDDSRPGMPHTNMPHSDMPQSGTSHPGMTSSGSEMKDSKQALPVEDAQRPGSTASKPGVLNEARLVSSYQQLKTGNAIRGGAIIDKKVLSANGDELGKVTEIAVSPDGNITSVVVSVGGVMGVGERLVVIPWDALDISTSNDHIKTSITKTEIAQAPQFDNLSDRGLKFEMKDRK